MEYHLFGGEQAVEENSFLPELVQERIRKNQGWMMIGQDEKEKIVTVGAFTLQEGTKNAVELAYLYTIPEERENGYAMGLLYTAENLFLQNGFSKIVCMPIGEREEILDFTHFLLLAGFEPVLLDGHICMYDRSRLLQRDTIKPYLDLKLKQYSHLSKNEMGYYARTLAEKLPGRFHEELLRECDEEKSVFAIENGEMMAAILLGKRREDRAELLNVYMDPNWKQKQQLLAMLVQVLREMEQEIREVNVVIDDDRVRNLFRYVLGEAETDLWVQRYEKELTGMNALEDEEQENKEQEEEEQIDEGHEDAM